MHTYQDIDPANPPGRRIGAFAVIRNEDDDILLIQPRSRKWWILPGGGVHADELPHVACEREVREETGLGIEPVRLLVVDYVPANLATGAAEGYNFVYDGEVINSGTPIELQKNELSAYAWVPLKKLATHARAHTERRIRRAVKALESGRTAYLVRGEPVTALDFADPAL